MATNAPVPGDDTVPSARAERRRARIDDKVGIWLYAGIVLVLAALILSIVTFA